MEDDGDFRSAAFLFGDGDEGVDSGHDDHDDRKCWQDPVARLASGANLASVAGRIGSPLPLHDCDGESAANTELELEYRAELVRGHMGSLALCRGARGDVLREAGALDAALNMLDDLNPDGGGDSKAAPLRLPPIGSCNLPTGDLEHGGVTHATLSLASACMGSVRDLACGSAANRSAICAFRGRSSGRGGVRILSSYVRRCHPLLWGDILALPGVERAVEGRTERGKKELRLLADGAGAIRNATHSSPSTCEGMHREGVTEMFSWRLKHGEGCHEGGREVVGSLPPSLPDATRPWREACFRMAGSLINISERCPAASRFCGSDPYLVMLLVEAWGGRIDPNSLARQTPASTPMLHLGLATILHAAEDQRGLNDMQRAILDKEEARKRFAQRREFERKERKERQSRDAS